MVRPRPDAPLLSHLADLWGDEAVRGYQSLPYLLLPGGDFLAHLLERQAHLQEMVPDLELMPWPDCVLDVGPLLSSMGQMAHLEDIALDLAKVWVRASYGDLFKQKLRQLSPYVDTLDPSVVLPPRGGWRDQGGTCVLEIWTRNSKGYMPKRPTTALIPTATPWDPSSHGYWHPVPVAKLTQQALTGIGILSLLALLGLAYLCQSPEYYVEVEPVLTPREQKQEEKAAKKRPELKRDLSYFILLDPLRAHEYGCPTPQDRRVRSTETEEEEHTRKQRPHMRRGHWRVLRAPRFGEHRGMVIPVRAAWVGPQEWTSEGLRYRVTEPLVPGTISHLGPVRRLPGADPPSLRPSAIERKAL